MTALRYSFSARSAAASSGSDARLQLGELAANWRDRRGLRRQVDGTLIRPGQRQLAEKRFDIEVERDDLVAQRLQQLRLARRVGRVMQVDGMHESASHHHGPEAVGDVLVEARLVPSVVREASLALRLNRGTGRTSPAGLHLVFVTGREDRLGQLGVAENSWTRHMVIVLDEHGVEREVGAGLLGVEGWSPCRLPCVSGHTPG